MPQFLCVYCISICNFVLTSACCKISPAFQQLNHCQFECEHVPKSKRKIDILKTKIKKPALQMPRLLPAIALTVATTHEQQPFTLCKLRINFRIIWRHAAEHTLRCARIFRFLHTFQNNGSLFSPLCMYVCL